MTDSPINLPEERYEYSSFELPGGGVYHSQHELDLFYWMPHLPNPQRALAHNPLTEDEIHDLRSRISTMLPGMFESLFAELSLETLKRYQRVVAKLEALEQDYKRLRAEVASLHELVKSSVPPSVGRVLEGVHNESADINPQERKALLKKAAEKRAISRQLDADLLTKQIQDFVQSEISNSPTEDY